MALEGNPFGERQPMTQLMLEIVGVWLVVILIGFPLFASMGLAAFAFVILAGSRARSFRRRWRRR